VTVLTSDEELSQLTAEDIVVQVNVAGLQPGAYSLRPVVALPPNVTWVASDPPSVTVTIRDPSVPPVVSPAASATP
jgi:YbbR domain-containing protein